MPYIDPKSHKSSDLPGEFVEANKPSSDSGWSDFRDVYGGDHGGTSNAHARNNTTAVDETKTTVCICAEHQTGSEDEESCEDRKCLFPSVEEGEWVSHERTEEGAGLVAGDDVGALEGDGRLAEEVKSKFIFKRVKRDGAADERAVISDHHCGTPCNGGREVHTPIVDIGGCWTILDLVEKPHGDRDL